ncbi:unnamed protein product [Linum trigynum]|uniref:RING-type E3 ubiquitin transferase n=1 Tax=Linum trigynum TaxID=586398 RepID=A0AAV2GUF8_9ROSI
MDFVASPRFFSEVTLQDPPPLETNVPRRTTLVSTTSSTRLHVTVHYTMIQRQIFRYGRILAFDPVLGASMAPPPHSFDLGTLGMLRIRPAHVLQNLAAVWAHLGIPEWARQHLGLSLTRQIDELAQDLPRTLQELRVVWRVKRVDDVVHNLQLDDEPTRSWFRQFAMAALVAAGQGNGNNNNGMVPAAPEALAKLAAVEAESVAGRGESCSICLDELGGGGGAAAAMPCKHVFHEQCIVSWLKRSHYCPICRFEMPTAEDARLSLAS